MEPTETINALDPTVLLLVGAFLPLPIAVINSLSWSSQIKALVAFAIAIAVGVGVAWFQDEFTKQGVLYATAAVYGISQVTQGHFWKPANVTPRIEAEVLPRGVPPSDPPA